MSYNVPPPANKPVWPIVLACLVLVAGIAVAAVFVGMNLADDDDDAASDSRQVPTNSAGPSDEPAKSPHKTKQTEPAEDDESPKPSDSPEPSESPETETDEPVEPDPDLPAEVDCGGDDLVLTTRTPSFAASICQTGADAYVYRGKSDDVADGIVLQAQQNAAGDWFATNEGYAYLIDGDTGKLTIRDGESNVVATENAIEFSAS